MTTALTLLFLLLAYLLPVLMWRRRHPEPRWDWSQIKPTEIEFPPGFVWGVATAAHQVEGGCDNNNWSRWEQSTDALGKPRVRTGERSGAACDHWNRFRDDIELARRLGVQVFRMSVEWSRIEPRQGQYDEAALAHYHEVIDAVRAAGLEPMVTLHHFTDPLWFTDLGGFEREENVDHLVRFGERVFREYSGKVRLWCTINEPEVYATMGWSVGMFPPGKKSSQQACEVIWHLLQAHTRLYHTLKALPGGAEASIGLVKNICQFDPWNRWNILDWLLSRAMNRVYNDAILEYLKSGRFRLVVPGVVRVVRQDPQGARCLDYLGVNYYSHIHVQLRPWGSQEQALRYPPQDVMTDMPYVIYAEGLYRALQAVRNHGVPIWVTENGIADAKDDRRALWIERYLYALRRAMQDGVDVRGYIYWSLLDNFEWAEGYAMRFGLYEVNYATQERRLRKGAEAFVRVVRRSMGQSGAVLGQGRELSGA